MSAEAGSHVRDTCVGLSGEVETSGQFADDKTPDARYMGTMINRAANYWYFGFTSSLAVGGLRSI